jgi:hypothetical protein
MHWDTVLCAMFILGQGSIVSAVELFAGASLSFPVHASDAIASRISLKCVEVDESMVVDHVLTEDAKELNKLPIGSRVAVDVKISRFTIVNKEGVHEPTRHHVSETVVSRGSPSGCVLVSHNCSVKDQYPGGTGY